MSIGTSIAYDICYGMLSDKIAELRALEKAIPGVQNVDSVLDAIQHFADTRIKGAE